MVEFGALPIFVAVVDNGGISPAARQLGLSKSAVSKRIAQLEEKLGVRLLYRTTRRLSLTEAGERYYDNAVKALNYACAAEDAVTQLQSSPRGRLKINAPMSFGRLHIAPLIADFLMHYPEIQVDMVMDDRIIDLVKEGFDIAIRGGELPDSSLTARPLAPLRSIVCASPDYLERHGRPSHPEALLAHNCLQFSYSAAEWTFLGDGAPTTVRVAGNYQVNNSEALRQAVLNGLGIARIPTFVVGRDIAEKRLVQLLCQYPMPERKMYALFPKRRHLPTKVRVFIDFVVDRIGATTPDWDVS